MALSARERMVLVEIRSHLAVEDPDFVRRLSTFTISLEPVISADEPETVDLSRDSRWRWPSWLPRRDRRRDV